MNKKIEERIAICKDVLKLLAADKIFARSGAFFWPRGEEVFEGEGDSSAQDYLKQIPRCEVCAKGALTVAWILKNNNCKMQSFQRQSEACSEMQPDLVETFGEKLLDCLETAFEGNRYESWNKSPIEFAGMLDRKADENDKIKDLMQNIIDNEGYLVFGKHRIG